MGLRGRNSKLRGLVSMGNKDPLRAIQEKITNLENHNASLEKTINEQNERIHKYQVKVDNLKGQLNTAQGSAINKSELEILRLENGKLLVELNKAKRDSKANEKLKRIADIINQ